VKIRWLLPAVLITVLAALIAAIRGGVRLAQTMDLAAPGVARILLGFGPLGATAGQRA
jgi:hypothetical protein